jgi:putative membrane protein
MLTKEFSMPRMHKIIYAVYIVIWIVLAINPKYRQDWLLENVLVFVFFPIIIWFDIKYRFTLSSIVLLFIFTTLHTIGAHYTYAETPFFEPVMKFFSLDRNGYDRVVHFLFGLLLFRPVLEIITSYIKKGRAALIFAFFAIISISTLYELLEWAAAVIFHPELGMAFLGTQGDVWDAHKDTLAATIGGVINLLFHLKDR